MIVLTILFAVAAVVVLMMEFEAKKIAAGLCFVFAVLFFLLSTLYIVDPGAVGVEVLFGNVTKYSENGLHWKNPFASIITFNTRTVLENHKAEGTSQDLQLIKVDIGINYRIDTAHISDLYQKIGANYSEKIIEPAIQEVIKASTSGYKVEDIIVKRIQLKDLIEQRLKDKLLPYFIVVQDVNLTDIDFSEEFNKVVEEKQIQEQKIKTADYIRQQAILNKQSTILAAEGEARRQELLRQTTSPEVVSLQWISKWNGVLPTTVMGNAVPMINLGK